jgi:transposase InsO family protein
MMELSTSSYHADPKFSRADREEWEANMRDKIENLRVEFPRAGYRMLLGHLHRAGIQIGERRLRSVLDKFKLHVRPLKRFVHTTDSNHSHPVHPNLLHELTVDNINQVWTADITYIRINNGFVYLAVILDVFSRKVIGWQISKRIDGKLALDALRMALARRKPKRGVIHHADRGVQYLCGEYTKLLLENGFHISCSAKGNPYDNAWTESFMKTLKYDEVYLWNYETYLDVIERVPYFIEEVYNKTRLHSKLGYVPPEEFEEKVKVEYEQKTNNVSRTSLKL